MAKIIKIKKGTETGYPLTIPQAVLNPETGRNMTQEIGESLIIKNEVKNGDFRNGKVDWRESGYFTGYQVIDGIAETTYFGNTGRAFFQDNIVINEGDKVYVSLKTKVKDIEDSLYLRIVKGADATFGYSQKILTEGWNLISEVVEWGLGKAINIYYGNKAGSEFTQVAYLDYLNLINLTEMFGAGKEPSQEEFESLLSQYESNYVEGEHPLSDSELSRWYMSYIKAEDRGSLKVDRSNKVLVIPYAAANYFIDTHDQLIEEGFIFEYTSIELFATHQKEFAKEFGTLVFSSAHLNINPLSDVTPQQVVDSLLEWKETNKFIYLNNSSGITVTKTDYNNITTEASLAEVLDITRVDYPIGRVNRLSVEKNSYLSAADGYDSSLIVNNTAPSDTYVLNAVGTTPIIYGSDDDNSDLHMVVKSADNKFIYVSYGGTIPGNSMLLSGFKYVNIGKLVNILWGTENSIRLAHDLMYNNRIVASAVDCDVTNEPDSLIPFLDAFRNKPIELGLVVSEVTDDLVGFYKGTGQDVCSHGYWHRRGNSVKTVTESYIVNNSNFIILKKPYHVKNIEVRNSDNQVLTVLSRGLLPATSYKNLQNGYILFNPSLKGTQVTVKYQHDEEPKEWIGSIAALDDLNVATRRAVYLTGAEMSVHPSTYNWMKYNDVTVCDHTSFQYRSFYMLKNQKFFKSIIPWFSTTFMGAVYGSGFDDGYKKNSLQECKDNINVLIDYTKGRNLPFVWYSHDFNFAEFYYKRIFENPTGEFPSWWPINDLDQIRVIGTELLNHWVTQIDNHDKCEWIARSEYNKRFGRIIENVRYSSFEYGEGDRVIIENRGETIKGITFRKFTDKNPAKVKIGNFDLEFLYNNGELRFSFDLIAGSNNLVEITYLDL